MSTDLVKINAPIVIIQEIDGELVSSHTIDELLDIFIESVKEADRRSYPSRLRAAFALLGIKQIIEAGLNGDQCKFWPWFIEVARRSPRDGEKLLALTQAKDPKAAYLEAKARNAAYNREYRARKKLELADLREAHNCVSGETQPLRTGSRETETIEKPTKIKQNRLPSWVPDRGPDQTAVMDEIDALFATLTMPNQDAQLIRLQKIIRERIHAVSG
jgi:hypothetical protein